MHVALIAHSRHPISEPFAGGLESMTWNLSRQLARRGHRVSVFAPPGSDPVPGVEFLQVDPLMVDTTSPTDLSTADGRRRQVHHRYRQVMVQLGRRRDIDVVHNNSLHHLPLAMAGAALAPTVTTLHTPPLPWMESAIEVMDRSRSTFVAVSEHTARAWSRTVAPEVVPNGVDTRAWTPGPGGEELVWSGRMVPEKAPHLAVEIARRAGMPLRLAGPVSDPAYFEHRIRPQLGGGVSYLGHLHARELAELVGSSAAALVTPDWDEPYGLVAAEALACGTPVAGFLRGGLREVVAPHVGRLLPPGDVDAVARVLPAVVRLSRRDCREHAVRHCSLDVMVDRYLHLYTKAIAPPERAPRDASSPVTAPPGAAPPDAA